MTEGSPQPAVTLSPESPAGTLPPSASLSRPLRILPAILLVLLQWTLAYVPGWIVPGTMVHFMTFMWAPIAGSLAVVLWWLVWSRAPRRDKWIVLAAAVLAGGVVLLVRDATVLAFFLVIFGLPRVTTAWVGWLAVTGWLNWPARRAGLLAVVLLTWGYHALIRLDGTDGSINVQTSWRWSPTAEELFLSSRPPTPAVPASDRESAEGKDESAAAAPELAAGPEDWPEFRGPQRDNRLVGVTILDDWAKAAPKQVWRHRLGPGWGSFAVVGDRLFTQEQRGEEEAVVCYRAADGAELWVHRDATRFWEAIAGAGPRATPTFHEGKLYTVGANGKLNCLDAVTGKPIWGVDMIDDPAVTVPPWGYASSPLIVGTTVIVLPSRPTGSAVQAYDVATGKRLWSQGDGTHSYSSPQLATFDGVPQILSQTDQGLSSIDASSGEILWQYTWPTDGSRVLQPYVDGDSVILTTYFGLGSRRVRVTHTDGVWGTSVEWESKDFKPYFNDFVVHDGFAYGFDINLFCCLDLKTGKRTWKKGRYGYGQVLLIADQNLLLVLSETGEAVLLKADPKQHVELGRFQAIEGKTWNHPVIVRGKLYVRNAEEMACYDVAPAERVADATGP